MSLNLKDAYFHVQVAPHHRRFLRFAFEWMACQYKVLPFGLSLAPRTFTRCMDAALSPLQQMGIRILNYLNDWLILAQLQVVLTSHPPPQPLRLPRAYCHPASEFRSWAQLSTQMTEIVSVEFSATRAPLRKGPPVCSKLSREY